MATTFPGRKLHREPTEKMSNPGRGRLAGAPYWPSLSVLLVGDGNFSFSLALANSLREQSKSAPLHLTATSYDTITDLEEKYPDATEHISTLRRLGVCVHHGVDAMHIGPTLETSRQSTPSGLCLCHSNLYDRILFQFPLVHPGRTTHERFGEFKNQYLLHKFLRSAGPLLAPGGEAHITSKICHPYSKWRIATLAEGVPPMPCQCSAESNEDQQQPKRRRLSETDTKETHRLEYAYQFTFKPDWFPEYSQRNVRGPDPFPLTDKNSRVFVYKLRHGAPGPWQPAHVRQLEDKDIPGHPVPRLCEMCNVDMESAAALEAHCREDARHVLPATQWEKMRDFVCRDCNSMMTSKAVLDAHLRGKVHRKELEYQERWRKIRDEA